MTIMVRYKKRWLTLHEPIRTRRKKNVTGAREEKSHVAMVFPISIANMRPGSRRSFHLAKNSGNFRRKSNGKVRFSFFRPEYSGPPLDVVHFDLSDRSEQNLPFHFDKAVQYPSSLQ